MTVFADASALISMIAGESDADFLGDTLGAHVTRLTSAIARWETVAGLCRSHRVKVEQAQILVDTFLAEARISLVAIDETIGMAAIDAYRRYGKGRHEAALNMGDCFAYACACHLEAELLYKGNDFSRTDKG